MSSSNYAAIARKAARNWLATNPHRDVNIARSHSCAPSKKLPKAVDKRRRGRYVEYLIVPAGKKRDKGVWKKGKDMSSDEKDACRNYRESTGETGERRKQKAAIDQLKSVAKEYANAASKGDAERMNQIERQYSLSDLSKYLAEPINAAETWKDYEVNDWGKVKETVEIYKDTPLIGAIRRKDLKAVHALLRSGLADPTLQMSSKHFIDDYNSMPESYKEDAMSVSKGVWAEILANYKIKAGEAKVYVKTDVNDFAARTAANIVQNIHDATKIAALIEVASTMWPDAPYRSPIASRYGENNRGKHTNRMHGVTDDDSQTKVTKCLRKKLESAIENCLLEPIDEASIASIIEGNNYHFHVEKYGKKCNGGSHSDSEEDYSSDESTDSQEDHSSDESTDSQADHSSDESDD